MSRSIDVDTKTFIRFWVVILAFFLLGLFILKAAQGILIVLTSIFLAIALKPLARKIDRIDKRKDRSSLSSVIAVIIVVVGVVAIVSFVGPTIISETSKFISNFSGNFSSYIDSNKINNIGQTFGINDLASQLTNSISATTQSLLSNISGLAVDSLNTVSNFLTTTVLIIVLTIMFMLQGPTLMDKFWKTFSGKNSQASEVWRHVIERMTDVIAKYVSGQVLVAILDGIIASLITLILSFMFGFSAGLAIPMGLIAMIFYLIPMFGPIISAVLITLTISFNSIWAGISFLIIYIVYEQIENNIISPKIQGKGMSLPPLLILVSITIGMYAFGLIGCIIAIPIAGCIKVFIEEYPNIKKLSEDK